MSTTPTNPFAVAVERAYGELTAIEAVVSREADAEEQVRRFAVAFPGPNVTRMLALCEDGTISWSDALALSARAIQSGIDAVKTEAGR